MSTVIRTDLDDMAVQAGFKRMQDGATKTGVAIDRMAKQTMTGAKVSAEGLGFVSQALGRIHPSLALLGEQSTKQLPTIMALGTSMSKYVFAGGALAAIGVSTGKIAFEMSKVRHETVDANSALGQLIETSNTVKKDSFFGRLMSGALAASLRAFGTSQAEIEEQQRDMARGGSWRDKGEEGKNRSEGIANSMRSAQDQRQKVKDYTSGIDGMDSASKIQRLMEAEKQRIAGLVQLGKLTEEEAQASDAYTQALQDQYDTVIGRINELRDVEKDLATEEKQRWIGEIETQKEAKKVLDDLIGEYHQLYNTDQLTAQRKKELLTGIAAAQGKYNEKLAEERESIKANTALIKEQAAARAEARREMEKERAGKLNDWAAMLRQGKQGQGGAGGGNVGAGGIPQQGGGPQGWRQWGGAAGMGINPFGPGMGNARGGDVGQVGDDAGDGGLVAGPAPMNAKLERKARAAARRAFKEQVDTIRKAFDDEMAAADKLEKQGVDVGDQRKDMARRRNEKINQAKADRPEKEQEELVNVQKDARDKQIDAAGKRNKLNQDQIEVMRDVVALQDAEIADIAALQKDMAAIKAALGRAANNQRGNGR